MKIRTALLLLPLWLAACGSPEKKAGKLIDNAAFEELQGNIPRAEKLYQRVLQEYPETDAADQAQKRLAELAAPE